MAESPRRADLRLTIPAASPYREVAVELAAKFAEYLGATAANARTLADRLSAAIAPLADVQPDAAIDLDMWAQDGEVVVTTNAGKTTNRTTCPLPD